MLRKINQQKKDSSKDKKERKELLSSKNIVKSDIENLNVIKEEKETEIKEKESDLAGVISEISIKKEEAKVVSTEKKKKEGKLSDLKEEVVLLEIKVNDSESEISRNNKSNKLILGDIAIGKEKLTDLNTEIREAEEKLISLKDEKTTLTLDNSKIKKNTDELSTSNDLLKEEKTSLENDISNLNTKQKEEENKYLFAVQKRDQEELEYAQEKSEMQTDISSLNTEKKEAEDRVRKLNIFADKVKKEIQEKVDSLLAVKDSLTINLKKEQMAKVDENVSDFIKNLGI